MTSGQNLAKSTIELWAWFNFTELIQLIMITKHNKQQQ